MTKKERPKVTWSISKIFSMKGQKPTHVQFMIFKLADKMLFQKWTGKNSETRVLLKSEVGKYTSKLERIEPTFDFSNFT